MVCRKVVGRLFCCASNAADTGAQTRLDVTPSRINRF
jgi:hypothetical protein